VSGGASSGSTRGASPEAMPETVPETPRRLLLATGGSGGHVFPALALAAVATERSHEVRFVGGRDGMEGPLVREAGHAFVGVRTGKFDRSRPDPRAPLRALAGLIEARAALRAWRPDVVVAFGGFASFPGAAAALTLGVPLVLHETNAVPGLVTRWFARRAALVIVCQSVTATALRRARTRTLPFPVREASVPKADARAALGLPQGALVTLVMGGSQGSLALNRAAPAAFRRVSTLVPEGRAHWVLHASGTRWHDEVAAATAALPTYRVAGFVDATLAWSAADLALTRGGFGTLAEAAYHGVPLVVMPLPSAADDHQRHNAIALAEDGAGRWVPQGDDDALVDAWCWLLDDEHRRHAARAMRARSPAGGAEALFDTILPIAAGQRTDG
jgi:UDP-N-acetylglucosamine--N-acetylmuramyl-(pentapeptide) pyrophosphoryl-undecaprenol N-acetylglucosamine transferase